MISPETDASSFTKAEKSIAVMPRAPHRRRHPTYRRSASPATAAAPCRPASVVPRSRAGQCSAGAKAGFMSISGASRAASSGVAVPLVATLISIYIVSQFLRNSIGVIAPNLAAELVLSPAEIGLLSSVFFLVFAAVQIPLGMALDRFGPRLCLMVGAAITVVGTVVFALATSPGVLILGRALLGMGTAGSLVASLAVYAQRFRPERFATLTGLQVGIGTLGTLMATAPLALSTAAIGWRASFLAVGGFTLMVAVLIAAVVRDDARPRSRHESWRESLSGILAVMRTPSMGRLFVMNLAAYSTFGLIVGLWGAPYLTTHLRLRPGGARRLPARGGADPDRGSDAMGSDGPRGGEPQAAGSPGRRNERRRARRPRAGRGARPVDAGAMVCGVRVRDRLRPAPDRARQGAVSLSTWSDAALPSSTWRPWAAPFWCRLLAGL